MADQQEVRCPTLFVGELPLDGGLRGVRRVLPIAIEAGDRKIIPIDVSAVHYKRDAVGVCRRAL
jgi:hypothetical protein